MNYFISRERLKNALKLEHLELEKMTELDQAKSRFYANVSHEIRTPVTLILSPLERLVRAKDTPEKIKKPLEVIYRNAHRLLRMTDQLLDVHKMEAGELSLDLARGDFIQFVQKTTRAFREYAGMHDIDFRFEAKVEAFNTWFDPDKVDKIIYNLLSNAFKFTPDKGRIAVAVDIKKGQEIDFNKSRNTENTAGQYAEIVIRDTGGGLSDGEIKHIFERFYQTNEAQKIKYSSGVGLALVYELIRIYDGEIAVQSVPGKGSVFTVWLPVDLEYLEKRQLLGHINLHIGEKNLSSDHEFIAPAAAARNATPKKEAASMLIIEDDQELLNYIADEFGKEYRLFTAKDGMEGSRIAFETIPDIIISDVMMPHMNGDELCRRLKGDERSSHIPIILLTAQTSHEHRIKALACGADVYLPKPFSMDVLKMQVANLLMSRQNLRDRFSRQVVFPGHAKEMTTIDEKFLKRVVKNIEENIADPDFNAEALSKMIGMSRMQLYRKMRALTNQTVHEFIRKYRLQRAEQLLKKKRITITEVAYAVGFNDLTYFARCFRRQYGKSPSEYIAGASEK